MRRPIARFAVRAGASFASPGGAAEWTSDPGAGGYARLRAGTPGHHRWWTPGGKHGRLPGHPGWRDGEGPLCVFPTASAEPQESMESAICRIRCSGRAGNRQWASSSPWTTRRLRPSLPRSTRSRAAAGSISWVGNKGASSGYFDPTEGDSPAYQALMAALSGRCGGFRKLRRGRHHDRSHDRWREQRRGPARGGPWEGGRGRSHSGEGPGLPREPLVDQHFLARGRWARLLVAVLETDAYYLRRSGSMRTRLWWWRGTPAWVVGESGVVFFDTRDAVPGRGRARGLGIVVSLLGPGTTWTSEPDRSGSGRTSLS